MPVVRLFFNGRFGLNYELFVFLSKRLQPVTFFFIFAIVFIKIGGFYEEIDDFVIDGRSVGYDNEHGLHEWVWLVAPPPKSATL